VRVGKDKKRVKEVGGREKGDSKATDQLKKGRKMLNDGRYMNSPKT